MARSDINKEPSGNKSSVSPKVADTSSPTIFRSAVPSAMLSLSAALAPLRSAALRSLPRPSAAPLSAPPLSALSPAPARRRRAHRRPPRASDAFFSTQRPPLSHDYIKSMVSLIRCTIVRLFYWSLSRYNTVFGVPLTACINFASLYCFT